MTFTHAVTGNNECWGRLLRRGFQLDAAVHAQRPVDEEGGVIPLPVRQSSNRHARCLFRRDTVVLPQRLSRFGAGFLGYGVRSARLGSSFKGGPRRSGVDCGPL